MSNIIDFADKLRSHADIVEIVEGYVPLRRGGSNLKGQCPFHREKSPSFTVSPSKQIFHCFGCHEGGDVIKFIQKIERLEWIEAVRWLADKYGLAMPDRQGGPSAETRDEREKLTALCEMATRHFHNHLIKTIAEPAHEISRYLSERGITAKDIARFNLGLAPDGWTEFTDAARKAGYRDDSLVTAGLTMHKQESNRYYDRFRNRLIFPIMTPAGSPVAFGARVFSSKAQPDEPKYVNSPETPLYHKGQFLFGLSLARDPIQANGQALVMEGYMDVIRAHQMGFTNAVATCGTAMTEEQARGLRRTCSKIVFAYDGDDAGQKAMLRGIEILLGSGFETIKIMVLPGNHDPDSFLREFGPEPFAERLNESAGFFEFFLARARQEFDQRTPEGKAAIAEMLIPLLKKVGKSIAQNAYVTNLAEAIGVQETLILRQLSTSFGPGKEKNIADSLVGNHSSEQSAAERKMIFLLFECEPARQKAFDLISPEWLRDTLARKWFMHLRDSYPDVINWNECMKTASGEDEAFLRGLALMEETCSDPVTTISQLAARFHRHYLIEKTRIREKQMHELHLNGELEHVESLCRECDESSTSVKNLTNSYFLKPANRRSAH